MGVLSTCPLANRETDCSQVHKNDLTQESVPINMPIRKQNCPKQKKKTINIKFYNFPNHSEARNLYFSFYIKQLHLKSKESESNIH